jgi:hypothetical protein
MIGSHRCSNELHSFPSLDSHLPSVRWGEDQYLTRAPKPTRDLPNPQAN